MLRNLNQKLVRLAFPMRSAIVDSLVDSNDEREELRTLAALTSVSHESPGAAAAYIERPFLFPCASRFSDGTFGVLYAANSLATAVRETAYHMARIFADGNAPAMETRRTELSLRLCGRIDDIRRAVETSVSAALYDPVSYRASQRFGVEARGRAVGVHYDSVRNPSGGHCVGAFSPGAVAHARIVGQVDMRWDGTQFIEAMPVLTL